MQGEDVQSVELELEDVQSVQPELDGFRAALRCRC